MARSKAYPIAAMQVHSIKRTRGRHNSWFRRLAERFINASLMGERVTRFSYRRGWQGRLGVTRREVTLTRDSPFTAPLTIAFASDFHAGPTTDAGIFREFFDALSQASFDVLLLGGDFVSTHPGYIERLLEGFAACRAPLGKYAVLGNHDLWAGDCAITNALAKAGVKVLVNRNVALPPPFEFVSICGLDEPFTGDPEILTCFAGAEDVRVFVTHSPDGLALLGEQRFDVGFAGHTHGGQIALPNGKSIIVPNGPLSRTYSYGLFDVPGNGSFIVSRGVGCSNLPLRINADPEVVICTIAGRVHPA